MSKASQHIHKSPYLKAMNFAGTAYEFGFCFQNLQTRRHRDEAVGIGTYEDARAWLNARERERIEALAAASADREVAATSKLSD